MSIRSSLAISIGKLTRWFLTTFTKGGSSLPGKITTTIDPNVLSHLAKDYDVIIITGTNGKTLTTALAVQALSEQFDTIITNPTGSNMAQGIVSTFLAAPSLPRNTRGIAVLEVDEGSLKHVVPHLNPIAFVHTNVFRDQMDRYGEIYSIYRLMTDAAKSAPNATVIANGDSPLFHSIDLPNPQRFYGFDYQEDHSVAPHYNTDGILCPHCHNILHYHSLTYANLGKYYCPHCAFKRPELTDKITSLDSISLATSTFSINQTLITLPVAGLYNIYNALAAYSIASFMGVSPDKIVRGFQKAQRVFGRQEQFEIDGKTITLNLVKNPVGLNQVISLLELEKDPFTLVCILNNRYADGTDVSWIWDGHYEQMQDYPVEQIFTSGMRADEMTLRLKVAGFEESSITQVADDEAIISAIQQSNTHSVHILATYTAMLDLRHTLISKGYLVK